MAHIVRTVAAALLAAFTLASPAVANEAKENAALAIATTLVTDAHAAMTAQDLGEPARFERLRQAVSAAFAFDIWEKFLIGDRNLDSTRRDEFRALLPGFLSRLYADQFGKGMEAAPAISGARPVRGDVMVAAAIPRANGKILPVEYRIREFEARGPLVIDIMVGGVSFLVLKRDEFKGLLDTGGADGLLAFMRANSV